ncbi:hypothetical protein BpHYR1_033895 [Brachionus plicatilis]|uniref:Uncharacterized protein n=1 Tax=Brachionus plicatilis TaxID=10195 RepID=A0A3M7S6U8_BRAPC|nr:hypothetical protein BpHYR1_033895 [Brachionus plicatilis]
MLSRRNKFIPYISHNQGINKKSFGLQLAISPEFIKRLTSKIRKITVFEQYGNFLASYFCNALVSDEIPVQDGPGTFLRRNRQTDLSALRACELNKDKIK